MLHCLHNWDFLMLVKIKEKESLYTPDPFAICLWCHLFSSSLKPSFTVSSCQRTSCAAFLQNTACSAMPARHDKKSKCSKMLPKSTAMNTACLGAISLWHNFWFKFVGTAFVTSHRKTPTQYKDIHNAWIALHIPHFHPYFFSRVRKLKVMQTETWVSERQLLVGWWKLWVNPMSNPPKLFPVSQGHETIALTEPNHSSCFVCVCVCGGLHSICSFLIA